MTSKELLQKRMEKNFARLPWWYREGGYHAESTHRIEGLRIACRFERRRDDLGLRVEIEGEAFASAAFHGAECVEEAVEWAAARITDFTDRCAKAVQADVRAAMAERLRRARLEYAQAGNEV